MSDFFVVFIVPFILVALCWSFPLVVAMVCSTLEGNGLWNYEKNFDKKYNKKIVNKPVK